MSLDRAHNPSARWHMNQVPTPVAVTLASVDPPLVGLAVKVSRGRPVFDCRFPCGDFSGLSHTSDLKFGTLVAVLPGAWRYRGSALTGWPGVSIL